MIIKRFYTFTFITLLLSLFSSAYGKNRECIREASKCFQVNPLLIKAIIWKESKNKQQTINVNKNNTVDVGLMQINTVHFAALKEKGIDEKQLRNDACINVFSGTYVLKQNIKRYGYTWNGIGNYHSQTPMYRDRYLKDIITLIANQTSLIDKIEVKMQEGIHNTFSCPQRIK